MDVHQHQTCIKCNMPSKLAICADCGVEYLRKKYEEHDSILEQYERIIMKMKIQIKCLMEERKTILKKIGDC